MNFSSVLITGGTGSFGRAFTAELLKQFPEIHRIVIYSRDEFKQYEMAKQFQSKTMRFFIGDIRDKNRLRQALEGIEIVIHAAALKHIPITEYNPFEAIKTNIQGAQNLIEACFEVESVKCVVALSTDKAAAPINLYGATKLCSDKLFIAANNMKGSRDLRFSCVRYGNVMGSRGSVIPFFLEQSKTGILPITHPGMTRFNIMMGQAVEMVLWVIKNAFGREIFVPKIPSYKLIDLAEAICPNCERKIIGMRPGEKIHEEMITASDAFCTVDLDRYFAILQAGCSDYPANSLVPEGFVYNSGTNPDFLSVSQIRELIKQL